MKTIVLVMLVIVCFGCQSQSKDKDLKLTDLGEVKQAEIKEWHMSEYHQLYLPIKIERQE